MSITVSGNLKDVATGAIVTGSWVRFVMRGTAGNQPFVSGTALLAPSGASTWFKDFIPDTSGAISGNLYSKADVSVGGQTGVISYGMQIFVNSGVTGPEVLVDASQNININNPNLLSVLPVTVAPTGDTTYIKLDGTNTPTGTISFPAGITLKKLDNIRFADQFGTLQAAHDDLPSTGGTVVISPGYSETLSANLVVSKSGVTFLFMGPATITMGSRSVTQAGGIHGTCFKSVIPFGGAAFTSSNGVRFIYTGSGKAINIGDGAGTTCRGFGFSNIAIDLTGASSGASGLYLTNVVEFGMNNPAVIGNNSTTGTKGIVLDGTGNFCGQGVIINPYVLGFGTGILGTGAVGAGANSTVIIGGTVQSTVASAIGVDLEIADSNSIYGLDVESCSVAVKFGANAAGNFVRIRQEVNTTDFSALAGSSSNVGQVERANVPVVSDAGTNNLFSRIQDGKFLVTYAPLLLAGVIQDSAAGNQLNVTASGLGVFNQIFSQTPGVAPLGVTSNPFIRLVLGTAATNNFTFQPAATAAGVTVVISDPGIASVGLPLKIASGTAVMTTAAITAGNVGATVTVSAPGVLTTDRIVWSFNAAPAGTNAGLVSWPTSGNVNFAYCSNTAETPAAATINWAVYR